MSEEAPMYTPNITVGNTISSDFGLPQSEAKEAYINDNKTEINADDMTMFPKPRSGCSRCYGRGFIGWNSDTSRTILCTCISNRIGKVKAEQCLTYGELMAIYNYPKTDTPEVVSEIIDT